jgi:hypothetical protein
MMFEPTNPAPPVTIIILGYLIEISMGKSEVQVGGEGKYSRKEQPS